MKKFKMYNDEESQSKRKDERAVSKGRKKALKVHRLIADNERVSRFQN